MSNIDDLQKHFNWSITEDEYLSCKTKLPESSTFCDIALSIFKDKLKYELKMKYWLSINWTSLKMFEAYYEEKRYKEALYCLINCLYIRLSGMNDTEFVSEFGDISTSPDVRKNMRTLKEYYDDVMSTSCYDLMPLPFHYFSKDVFKMIINDVLNGEQMPSQKYAYMAQVPPSNLQKNPCSRIMIDLIHDFVAIDFETANANNNSACSIGIVEVKNDKIVNNYYSLIKPPIMQFNDINISIHGIQGKDVENAPTFEQVWEVIKHYFNEKDLITAYNASFDMRVLRACLDEYKISIPEFDYFCTMKASTSLLGKKLSSKLCDRCEYFNVALDNAHNALCDAEACANVAIKLFTFDFENKRQKSKFINRLAVHSFTQIKPSSGNISKNFSRVTISDIKRDTNIEVDEFHKLHNKNIVFTGEFISMDKKEAMQKAVNLGAVIKSGVTKSTNFLVYGIQDKKIVGEDGLSNKQEKAYELIGKGIDIEILDEDEFLELIK